MEPGDGAVGCCSDYTGPDFSKINFKNLDPCTLSYVNGCDWNLWLSAAVTFVLPAFHPLIESLKCCSSPRRLLWPRLLEGLAFMLYVWKLWKFRETVQGQPTWPMLQENWVLSAGYIFFVIGGFFITSCLCHFGVWDAFFRIDFHTPLPGSPQNKHARRCHVSPHAQRKYRDMSMVFKAGAFCVYFGYSLVCASQAGVLLTVIQALAYYVLA